MGVIADKRLNLIRGLARTLPQASLRSLELALGLTKDDAMVEVRELISVELEFRHVKEAVFAPFLALTRPREDGLAGVMFEPWILDRLWAVLEVREPELYKQSRYALRGLRSEDPTPVVFFRLVTAAAEICREHADEVLPHGATAADREEVAEFANYLDLHRLMRGLLGKVGDFMGRIDADKAAALRLMFRDAAKTNSEGGYRFLECLFANLDDGAHIVKFIATCSDRPNDRFLASSELANFGERILDRIEEQLADLKAFLNPRNRGSGELDGIGARVASSLAQLQSFETYIELSRDGPWGKRIAEAHKTIAEMVEGQLKGAERLLGEALPVKSEKVYGKVRKETPRLDKPPREDVVVRCRQTMEFIRSVRNTANSGGFASLHARTVQALEQMMDEYFEELLAIANGPDAFDPDNVMNFFELVTDMMHALCCEEKAQVARRRVASSDLMKPRSTQTAGAA